MKFIIILLLSLQTALWSEEGGSKYKDQPVHIQADEQQKKLESAIAPYIKIAKESFPGVKDRYLAGLPKGSTLYVTYKIIDGNTFEVCFMKVISITE